MRILFLVSDMSRGGAERVASLLANAWSDRGDEVFLVATYSGRGNCVYSLSDNVRFSYLADDVPKSTGIVGYLHRLKALRSIAKRYQPDVVVSFLVNVNVFALLALRGLKVPVVISERIYPPLFHVGSAMDWLRRKTYPSAACIVVQTPNSHEWLEEVTPDGRHAVIANPMVFPMASIEPRLFSELLINRERKLLLAVGRLADQKQFDLLLQCFSLLAARFPEWDLAIIGEGPLRAELSYKVSELGLQNRTFLVGGVGNPGDWYSRADLYVMSSAFEGFPNTLLEAMAHGVAAVSFDCHTGPRDIIRHGVDGELVDPQAGVAGLTASLAGLMENEAKRGAYGERASEVRQRYSMERILLQWDDVFRSCLDAQGRER